MNEFKAGDRVQWMNTSKKGGGFSFSQREGVIVEIGANKQTAVVRGGNGRKSTMFLSHLRPVGQKGQVTELFEKFAEASRK